MEYLRDPDMIYERSFAIIDAEVNLSKLPYDLVPVARRVIHACGMTDLLDDLRYDVRVAGAVCAALRAGMPILVDVEMVAAAIITRFLPRDNRVLCTLNDSGVSLLAQSRGTTRTAAAVVLWEESLSGAVVVIGNAPTALFALLELIDATGIKPAAIIAAPVGFVGAVESKDELVRCPRGIPFFTLLGRRGGSAIAAAAFNAIAAAALNPVAADCA